ncbi:PREDICTED: galactoside 3(4)-L-fucosyltransferase-like [Nanorana parkeri]|uniref:galactoside 3(4)-L-fucosyltransferase-like n=1 Tax=Nanorana parkeri TaxID=125878 RepID=UPI0008548B68|nr:PREDICTED: galactoside 3(4)-L-fucosyltransferase-like [Nanorana parkeri]
MGLSPAGRWMRPGEEESCIAGCQQTRVKLPLDLVDEVGVSLVGIWPEAVVSQDATRGMPSSAGSASPGSKSQSLLTLLIILLWTWPSEHTFPLNQCPPSVDSSGCFFTVNHSMYSVASAVVMNHRDISKSVSDLSLMPRPPGQYWIWFNLEPPQHLSNLTLMDNIFNLTMSYRLDSDIFTPYGWIEKNDGTENFTVPRKTKLVAWVASNWNPVLRRIQYYNQMKKYIHVDVYGKNNLELPKEKISLSEYKFYLSFENYAHEDYITEKLWFNAFRVGTVPVVMGPPQKNYERFIPPDSFIHVDDFSSPQELASYLLSLDRDDERYYKYFNWRANYKPSQITSIWVADYCKVCKAVKEAPPYRTCPSIVNWFK